MRNYIVKIQHAYDGQPGVWRMPQEKRIKAADEAVAIRRTIRPYKKEYCKGKRKVQYQITITPL